MTPYDIACAVRKIYMPGCAFPEWVLKRWADHAFAKTTVYYHKEDSLESVQKILQEREPCNIGMRRLYDGDALERLVGYKYGAYSETSPNVAVACHADVRTPQGSFLKVRVLNVIGCALDSPRQPDFIRYNTHESVVGFYKQMWSLVLGALKHMGAKQVCIYNIGGGAFAGLYGRDFQTQIFEPAFLPLLPQFEAAGIQILGFDVATKRFTGGRIPDCLFQGVDPNTVFLNAWDPWSLIGNANECDNSLDGYWGRCSNMSVLGWLPTNPAMSFVGV